MSEFRVKLNEEFFVPDDMTVPQFMLDSSHPRRPHRPTGTPWLIQEGTGREVHYEEIRARVAGLANSLALDYGLADGDVACVYTPNHIDFPVAVWAAHRLGGIASCSNPSYTTSELVHILQASKSKIIFAHPPSLRTVLAATKQVGIPVKNIILFNVPGEAVPGGFRTIDELVVRGLRRPQGYTEVRLKPGEGKTKVAFLSFSSGTTGKPKAVAIAHYSPIANVVQTALHSGTDYHPKDGRFTPGGVALGILPFFHIYGLVVNIHYMLFTGMSVLVVPKFSFIPMCESIRKYNVSVLFLVPPQVVLLCKHPASKNYDWTKIKFLMSGAAPLTHELNAQVVKLLPNAVVGQGYGMTETSTSVCWPPIGIKVCPFGSAGQLMPGVIAKIVKPDGSLGKPGERGELVVYSKANALGYVDAEEANRDTFVDGWVRTGDEASIDEHNWVYVHDRLKELIKVRGYQVAPAELEGHLLGHPDVRDACVVGVPDEYSGELPMAFIALSETAAARAKGNTSAQTQIKANVSKHIADHMVKYKHLAGGVEIVDEIPKNPSGKLLRRIVREEAKKIYASRPKQRVQAKL